MHLSPFWLSNGLIVWQRKHRGKEGGRAVRRRVLGL